MEKIINKLKEAEKLAEEKYMHETDAERSTILILAGLRIKDLVKEIRKYESKRVTEI